MRISDWSSDVCSSDLATFFAEAFFAGAFLARAFFAAAFFGAAFFLPFAGPFAARASISAIASSSVSVAGSAVLGSVAFVVPRSEEHTSELQSLMRISYAVFCLKKNKQKMNHTSQLTSNHPTVPN